jgi:hypothetical protein
LFAVREFSIFLSWWAKAYDEVLTLKILILPRLYTQSDEQAAFQINDRHCFQRFLGLHFGSAVPDFLPCGSFARA